MTRVGWRLTRAARSELNSEYRRATSMSYHGSAKDHMHARCSKYSSPNSIDNVSPIGALCCIRDDDLQFWVLVEQLLYPAVISPLLLKIALTLALKVICLLVVANILGMREELGRLIFRGMRWRRT
jgi:hypothetical protein